MLNEKNILDILHNNVTVPAFIIDSDQNIVAHNTYAEKEFEGAAKNTFFLKLFDNAYLDDIGKAILEAIDENAVVKSELMAADANHRENLYKMVVSPLTSEDDVYYLITFNRMETKHDKLDIAISTSELHELIDDNNIINIIEQVNESFPFTFIGKSKVQRQIDQIDELFWIKDVKGRYVLVNSAYAAKLGLKPVRVEGRNESEFLPSYVNKFFEKIDNYVTDTANTFTVKGIDWLSTGKNKNNELIILPIINKANEVLAYIGVTKSVAGKKKHNGKHEGFNLAEEMVKSFNEPLILINKAGDVRAASEAAMEITDAGEGETKLDDFVDSDTAESIKEFTKEETDDIERTFTTAGEETGSEETVLVRKILDGKKKPYGSYILFNKGEKQKPQQTVKAKMYDIIMQTSPEAIFIYDIENLKFLDVNDAALKLYGYGKDEFLQMDLTDLYAPEDIQTLLESSNNKIMAGSFTGPWRHKKRNGNSVLVELSKSSLDYKGRRAHLNIVRDVSQEVENKKKLQTYKPVFDHSEDLILVADQDGFVTYFNTWVSEKLGYTKKDLDGRSFLSLVADEDRAKINTRVFHTDSSKTQNLEVSLKPKDGEQKKVELIATPIIGYDNQIDSFNMIIKLPHEAGGETKIEYVEKEGGGNLDPQFLSNLFHELLTPINVIIGFAQELTESLDNPTDEQKEAADIIKENQKLLMHTMDTAIDYTNIEQNKVEISPEPVKFVEIIDDIQDGVKKTADSYSVNFNYGRISSSLEFVSDKAKITTLLTHFSKFGVAATKESKLYISANVLNDNHYFVGLKDKKSGITDKMIESMNQIFSEDENLVRRNFGISRFTLRLVRKLVKLLSGKIEIVQKFGEANEYGIVFPMEIEEVKPDMQEALEQESKVEASPVAVPKHEIREQVKEKREPEPVEVAETYREKDQEQVREAVQPPEPAPAPAAEPLKTTHDGEVDLTQITCLYLEDQVDSQMLFKVQLKDLKSIDFAPSLEKAMPLLETKRYDVIVMDMNLQGEYNGLDALRAVQKMPGYGEVPIIAVTAYVQPKDRETYVKAGFSEFVSKPLFREKLVSVLQKVL